MARLIDFFDGAESETVPTVGNLVSSGWKTYPSDAAYEAAEQGAPLEGNEYFNTTDNVTRYYNGTIWQAKIDESTAQTLTNKTIDADLNTISNIDDSNVKVGAGINAEKIGNGDVSNTELSSLDGILVNVQDEFDQHQAQIDAVVTDVSDLRTLSGTADSDVDLGTFSGSIIPDNTTIKPALQSLETEVELKLDASEKGVANGVAELDALGKVPISQLPDNIFDEVSEYADLASFPVTGVTGIIYVALDTNKTYRWSGATYIPLNEGGVFTLQGRAGNVLIHKLASDNTSGSNVTLASIPITSSDLTSLIRLTNAALVSVDMLPAGYSAQPVVLLNKTGATITINNETGATPADQIQTGTGANLDVEPNASITLVYDSVSSRWNVVGGSGSGGGASITTPGTTIVNRVVAWDDVTGTALKQTPMSVDNSGVSTGLTEQTVATVKTSVNKVEGTASNTDFDLDANGTGSVKSLAPFKLNEAILLAPQTDSSSTGTNATLAAPLNTVLIIDNVNLLSVEGITAGKAWQEITLVNKTGKPIELLNETGTAANQIVNSNSQNIVINSNGSLKFIYDGVVNKWFSQRTDFVQSSLLGPWVSYSPTITTEAGTLAPRTSTNFRYRIDGPDLLIAYNIVFSGAGTGNGFLIFSLPTGYTISTLVADISNNTSLGQFGLGGWYDNSTTPQGAVVSAGTGVNTTLKFYGSGANGLNPTNVNMGASDRFNGVFRVPVEQLTQNTTNGIANQSNLEILSSTSAIKTPTASGNYNLMSGNSIVLKAGKTYKITSNVNFTESGSSGYSQQLIGLYAANGADTSSQPAFLSTLSTIQVLSKPDFSTSDLSRLIYKFTAESNLPGPRALIRVFSDTTIYVVPNSINTTAANARITASITAQEIAFSSTSINTGPIFLGDRVVIDDQTNATTQGKFYQNGPFIEMLALMTFTGVSTGGEVNMTIPSEFAASSFYNTPTNRPKVGEATNNDGGAPYQGSANLTTTTNLRIYATNDGSATNITTTIPFTWGSGDTIFITARWLKA